MAGSKLIASVSHGAGIELTGEVSHLTPRTLFLRVAQPLPFGSPVLVRILGLSLEGVVAFYSEAPKGAVVLFNPSPRAEAILRARQALDEEHPEAFEDPWEDETKEIDPTEALLIATQKRPEPHPVDAMSDGPKTLRNKPLTADLISDDLEGGDDTIEGRALSDEPTDLGDMGLRSPAAVGAHRDEVTLSSRPPASLIPAEDPEDQPPVLDEDGVTVRFASAAHYSAQYATLLIHGRLLVRSEPLPVGAQRTLALDVPGSGRHVLTARVAYSALGRVGFVADALEAHRGPLRQLARSA